MNGLAWGTPNGADRVGLGSCFDCAVITGRDAFLDDLDLTIEAGCAALDKWYISSKAHLVHMSSRLQIIQRIENNRKAFEPL